MNATSGPSDSVAPVAPWAVVTGAAGGIGRSIVDVFAAAGYRVIATDRMPAPPGMRCEHYLQLDVEQTVVSSEQSAAAFARIDALLGEEGLRALINNAAVQILGGVETLDRSAWQTTLNVNLLAPFFWTQTLLPQLEMAGGSVVNMSSIHAKLTKKDFVAYATSKAALSGLTRAMAVDLGARVRINAIEPAAIETEMLRAGFAGAPEQLSRLQAVHPLGRIGTPAEVARLALSLVQGDLGFLHGACVSLDGGIGSALHDPV